MRSFAPDGRLLRASGGAKAVLALGRFQVAGSGSGPPNPRRHRPPRRWPVRAQSCSKTASRDARPRIWPDRCRSAAPTPPDLAFVQVSGESVMPVARPAALLCADAHGGDSVGCSVARPVGWWPGCFDQPTPPRPASQLSARMRTVPSVATYICLFYRHSDIRSGRAGQRPARVCATVAGAWPTAVADKRPSWLSSASSSSSVSPLLGLARWCA